MMSAVIDILHKASYLAYRTKVHIIESKKLHLFWINEEFLDIQN